MINWQIQVQGGYPPDWDRHRDGCWFPDFDHQSYLLPFFDVGDTPIDPYADTELKASDLLRLRTHLRYYRPVFDAKPPHWSITETMGNQSQTMNLERDKVLEVVDHTLRMIDVALSGGGTIVFLGD
jgi:hypothetical protein